ncbi:MAG: GntR family transcriptional regulator [Rhodospirillaceae bacterium]|nr:GntR family transcriptional regulator [Rhodospirillaceae bacterium]
MTEHRRPAPPNEPAKRATPRGPAQHAPVRHGDNSLRVYDVLRQRIATRQYAPGERLTEAEIAAEFSISRTPVRQALHRLAVEGLIEVKNGVGIRVTEVDDAELRDIYELRMALATLMGRLSPRPLSESDLAELQALKHRLQEMLRAEAEPEVGEYADICDRFYARLNNVVGNAFLRQFQDQLYNQTDRYWYGWMAKADIRREVEYFYYEVEESLRALAVNDFDALGMIRRNHISMMLTRAESYRRLR